MTWAVLIRPRSSRRLEDWHRANAFATLEHARVAAAGYTRGGYTVLVCPVGLA